MKTIAKPQGIQILTDRVTGSALGTLAGITALAVEQGHGTGLLQSFLMKKLRIAAAVDGLAQADGTILIGMARGDASVTEIKTALEDAQLERDNKTQAAKRDVLHETVMLLKPIGAGTTRVAEATISLGGGKGIPFEDGDGWQWFVYNVDSSALTTGGLVYLQASYWGVWL